MAGASALFPYVTFVLSTHLANVKLLHFYLVLVKNVKKKAHFGYV